MADLTIRTAEVEHWKDGANGPFKHGSDMWPGQCPAWWLLLDNSGDANRQLGPIGAEILVGTGRRSVRSPRRMEVLISRRILGS